MTPQELKASILQLAIQGRLVEQRPEEGTGEELYQQIQAEKQRLIKAGIIRKEKPLPEITEEEIQFDIPKSWRQVRLGEVFCLEMGQSPDGNTVSERGTGIEFHQGKVYFGKRELQHSPQKTTAPTKYAEPDSVLLCVRAPVGKVNITKRKICIGRGLCAVKPICGVYVEFVYYWLATMENTFVKKATGTTFVAITGEVVKNQVIPLPPLAEQKRIVAKIEELLPYIDRYEKAWSKLEDFNKRFPADMQKSILQMAIQGKLVDQRPEEGTGEELFQQIRAEKQRLIKAGTIKKEKPLPDIAEDEILFDIPESWKWCRLSTLGITQTGNTPSKAHPEYTGTDVPFITPGDILDGQICYNNQALSLLGKEVARVCYAGTIMQVCIGGSIGKAAITDREVTFNQQINVVSPMACSSEYIFAVMQSAYFITTMKERAGGTATPIINRGLWDSLLVPLPPLAEQKRIVAKLEEILPLCDRLK